jgi:hypothetical protein
MRRVVAVKIVTIAVTLATAVAAPAHSQGLGKKGGGSAYPVENEPKVDEKAYKAALDRIPEPGKKYDPWGVTRSPETMSAGKKSN